MSAVFYHYTPFNKLQNVVFGGGYSDRDGVPIKGLMPLKRFITLGVASGARLPEKAREGAVFGLLDPVDFGWAKHDWGGNGAPVFEGVLNDFGDDTLALLEVSVEPSEDDIYIADYGVHLDDEYKGSDFADDPGTVKAKRAYFNSLTHWDEYHSKGVEHVLPEVICFSRIPLSRIRIVRVEEKFDVANKFRAAGGYPLKTDRPPARRRSEHETDFLKEVEQLCAQRDRAQSSNARVLKP